MEGSDHGSAGKMKKILLRTAFIIAVLVLTLMFLIPAQLLLEVVLPITFTSGGHVHGGDRLLQGILVMFGCVYAANRLASFVFTRTGLSDKRWSVLSRRTFG
jgi:hypothetical protein